MITSYALKMVVRKRDCFAYTYIAVVLFAHIVSNGNALSIILNDLECVSEHVPNEGDMVTGNFVVIDHEVFWSAEHPGIEFSVTNPAGHVVHSLKGTSGDKFDFKATQSGLYKFCFRNPVSLPETVSFHLHVGHIPTDQDLAKDEHMDPIIVKIAELKEALESIISEQKYLKARDTRHRYTNEGTRNRVIIFTLVEYLLLATASTVQVICIRRLFSNSVGYNRV